MVLTRVGLVAGIATLLTMELLTRFPMAADVTAWYGHAALASLLAIAVAAAYGLVTSAVLPRYDDSVAIESA
jgi:hypothetical protein